MDKLVYLKIDTEYGILTIPFIGIMEVDEFTVRYDNLKELVNKLIKILDLKIDLYDVNSIYLTYEKYNRCFDDKCFFVKYKKDNFNVDSLINVFCEYLEKDLKRIWKSNIRYVKTNGMLEFMNSGRISKFEIRKAVNAYLNDEKGYKRKRDTYFELKEKMGSKFNVICDKVQLDTVSREMDLSVYDCEDDSFLSHLIELYRRGDYTFDEVMDKIGQMDLQELSLLLKNGGYGIVDGVSECGSFITDDIKMLENCTGISIENLKLNYTNFGRKKGSRK